MEPSLNYIDEIADHDIVFKEKIISIIKREFPLERDEFLFNFHNKEYLLASENVHKLKHKINILGLKKGFDIAVKFENELKEKKNNSSKDFMIVLKTIENYLIKI
jgi:hypothetical protein